MSKKLVAFFSASGVTRKVAENLAQLEQADLFEIIPEQIYTKEDLDYTNKESRSTIEMTNPDARPAIKSAVADMEKYDIIFVGFPVWWGREPSIIDTFLEQYDLAGKTIIPFCTSAASPVDGVNKRMAELLDGKAKVETGIRLGGQFTEDELKFWTEALGL